MKLTSFSTGGDVITSGDFQQSGEFGIDSEGLVVVASILRDKLYQDKIQFLLFLFDIYGKISYTSYYTHDWSLRTCKTKIIHFFVNSTVGAIYMD